MKKGELEPFERIIHHLNQMETKPINEVITFTSKHKSLYIRFHKYRKGNKISESARELLDIGLKAKGY